MLYMSLFRLVVPIPKARPPYARIQKQKIYLALSLRNEIVTHSSLSPKFRQISLLTFFSAECSAF